MACSCGCRPGAACGCQPIPSCACRRARIGVRPPWRILGELRGLFYRRWGALPEAPRTYLHFFRRPRPLLVRDLTGRRLYIVGGCYRVTRRGIVG